MTGEEAKKEIIDMANALQLIPNTPKGKAVSMALKALEQEPCDDAISRQSAIFLASDLKQDLPDDEHIADMVMAHNEGILEYQTQLSLLPPVTPQPKMGHCKECKYFEYDSIAKVDGIPLIVAHEICKKWGDGCKTSEDGYCFLFEPQESEK